MPFDGVQYIQSLDATLAALGIKPIPDAVLKQHKAHEIAKHPASFFHGRLPLYEKCLLGSLVSTISGPIILLVSPAPSPAPYWVALAYFVVSLAVMVKLALFTRVREPARWIETRLNCIDTNETDIPLTIERLVARVQQADPSVKIVVGTLVQRDVVLDPYLLVEKCEHGSRMSACLGVWDGDRIIHLAGRN